MNSYKNKNHNNNMCVKEAGGFQRKSLSDCNLHLNFKSFIADILMNAFGEPGLGVPDNW